MDAVLSLGRTILTSPHTSADNQPFEKRLTDSIEAWSELQLGWQNWYQELMAASERSSAVSDRYSSFSDWLAQARSKLGSTFPLRVGPASAPADVEEAQVSWPHFYEELCEFCSRAFERDLDVLYVVRNVLCKPYFLSSANSTYLICALCTGCL